MTDASEAVREAVLKWYGHDEFSDTDRPDMEALIADCTRAVERAVGQADIKNFDAVEAAMQRADRLQAELGAKHLHWESTFAARREERDRLQAEVAALSKTMDAAHAEALALQAEVERLEGQLEQTQRMKIEARDRVTTLEAALAQRERVVEAHERLHLYDNLYGHAVHAVKSCISSHGPITKEFTGSAAKRIAKNMGAHLRKIIVVAMKDSSGSRGASAARLGEGLNNGAKAEAPNGGDSCPAPGTLDLDGEGK